MPRRGLSQNRCDEPSYRGVRQMSNCLDERPFTVDDSFSCARRNPTSPIDGAHPETIQDMHASRNPAASMGRIFARSGGAGRVPPQLVVHVNPVDHEILNLAVNLDVDEIDTAHHHSA